MERNAALYDLMQHYQSLPTEEARRDFLGMIDNPHIVHRIQSNVLGKIKNFQSTVQEEMQHSSEKARDWASRASQHTVPRVLMAIAGPTSNCGSGVVV